MKKTVLILCTLAALGSPLHGMTWVKKKLRERKVKKLGKQAEKVKERLMKGLIPMGLYLGSVSAGTYPEMKKRFKEYLIEDIGKGGTPQEYLDLFSQLPFTYLQDQLIDLQEKEDESRMEGGDQTYADDPLVKFFEPLQESL